MNLEQGIEKFKTYLEGKSPHTIRTYGTGLNRFKNWKGNVPVSELTTEDAIDFYSFLHQEKLETASVNSYLTAIVRFYRWTMRRKYTQIADGEFFAMQEELRELRSGGKEKKLPVIPEEQDIETVINTARSTDEDHERLHLYHLRNVALIEFLRFTGCRIGEARNMRRSDLIPARMAARVVKGKGKKTRFVWLDKGAWDAVQTYLTERDKMQLHPDGAEPLFSRHDKKAHGQRRMAAPATNSLRVAIYEVLKKAGVKKFTPHKFRHLRATEFLKETDNLELTRRLLGHEDISTTQLYLDLTDEDLEAAIRKEIT